MTTTTTSSRKERSARIARAVALHEAGELAAAESAYRAALEVSPGDPAVLHNLGVIAAESGRPDEAIAAFDRVLASEPGYVAAHFNRATALRAMGCIDGARDGFRRTVALAPDHYQAHLALAFLWQAAGERDRALDHFARTMELRRGEDRIGLADRSLRTTTPAKLRHDAEQFRHIAARGRERQRFELMARVYDGAADAVADLAKFGEPVTLTDDQLDRLGATYNIPFHVIDAPALPGAVVDPALDEAAIMQAFTDGRPGVACVDGLLTAPAFSLLRRFLLESTIWFDFTHIGGFVASYLEDGLACPLLLQIADDLRARLPALLGGRPLAQGWAFKALDGAGAIRLHADDAAVSVNFWLTPDAANRDPDHGGLVVCGAAPPADWRIAGYGPDAASIATFVESHAADRLVVPYRENRAVLFASRLFHGSDSPDFAPGYENRRINITLLYGGGADA